MNEAMRNAIVERRQAGASVRAIARALGMARQSVQRVVEGGRNDDGHGANSVGCVSTKCQRAAVKPL